MTSTTTGAASSALPTSPQLLMRRPTLEDLPPLEWPEGYASRHYEPGLENTWEGVVTQSLGWDATGKLFDRELRSHDAFRPERILLLFDAVGEAVGTASAWYRPEYGPDTGYVHMVGVLPGQRGKALGLKLSLACLYQMRSEGRTQVVLETSDGRLAAVKTYLRLGFAPQLVHENLRERWRAIFTALGQPELIETHASILEGPVVSRMGEPVE
jgi:mycothiol synthase